MEFSILVCGFINYQAQSPDPNNPNKSVINPAAKMNQFFTK